MREGGEREGVSGWPCPAVTVPHAVSTAWKCKGFPSKPSQVHRGFLTSFNDLMTGGTAKESDKTMEYVANDLLGGKAPAR